MSEFVIDRVKEFGDQLLSSMGLELVEVQFRREQHGWVLRVFVDNKDGINHDHCKMVSRELSDFLDVEDLIDHAYQLEVSSPGLERKLNSIDDFRRFSGRKAKVKLQQAINDQKTFVGEIVKVTDDTITLEVEDGGNRIEFLFAMISGARLAI